jgi:hypothetical protein
MSRWMAEISRNNTFPGTGKNNRFFPVPMILVFVVSAIFSSCDGYIPGFMDLRPIGIHLTPGKPGTLLSGEYSPVILEFDTEMKKPETEGIVQISSAAGVATGDLFWQGNRLYFVPSPPWTAGRRYVLNLSGTIYSEDGRELRLERYISFYAINKSAPPLLEWFSPEDGASVGNLGLTMEFRFSCPMERLSVESALTIEGVSDKKFEWSNDDSVLKIIPEKNLLPWTSYHWTLKGSAKSRDGVPLAKEVSARFTTDLDKLLPRVARVFPVIPAGGNWLPSGGGIETDLGPGQGIAVEFNKVMGDNVLRSLRFEPSLAGRTESLSDNSIVFIPGRDPDPETAYTLIVSADTKDAAGLKLGADFRVTFVPDIPYLRILSVSVEKPSAFWSGGSLDFDFNNSTVIMVPLSATDPGVLRFTIRFSLPFVSAEAKQNAALKIALSPFFPGTLDPIALRSAGWPFDDRMYMEWERLKKGTAGEAHFYRLLLPGGRGGISNGGGMYFKEDQFLYVEAVQ